MMKKKEFLSSVAALSVSMLIVRSTSMAFSVFVSSRLGAGQMGVFHLIISVYAFSVTVATSGIPLAATRLIAESRSKSRTRSVVSKCAITALCSSVFACVAILMFADKISAALPGYENTSFPLRLLAITLPPLAISAVMRGCFTGMQKVSLLTTSCMVEEFSSILTVLGLMKLGISRETAFFIPVWGIFVSTVTTCICDICMYFFVAKSHTKNIPVPVGQILAISAPVAMGSYIRSGLIAAENLIIPWALLKHGSADGVAGYGTVKAMAMPIITFPYVFLQSLTSMLVPEISGRYARENNQSVIRAAVSSVKWTAVMGVGVSAFLLVYGRNIATNLYGRWEAGAYVVALAFLAIPMYIDSVTDSLLKGLNQQVYCMKINIIDSALRVPVIYLLLPRTGIYGYIAVLYGSEILNLALSAGRLKKILVNPERV